MQHDGSLGGRGVDMRHECRVCGNQLWRHCNSSHSSCRPRGPRCRRRHGTRRRRAALLAGLSRFLRRRVGLLALSLLPSVTADTGGRNSMHRCAWAYEDSSIGSTIGGSSGVSNVEHLFAMRWDIIGVDAALLIWCLRVDCAWQSIDCTAASWVQAVRPVGSAVVLRDG